MTCMLTASGLGFCFFLFVFCFSTQERLAEKEERSLELDLLAEETQRLCERADSRLNARKCTGATNTTTKTRAYAHTADTCLPICMCTVVAPPMSVLMCPNPLPSLPPLPPPLLFSAADTSNITKTATDYKARIGKLTKKLMATVSELSMYQAQAMQLQKELEEKQQAVSSAHERMSQGLAPSFEVGCCCCHCC